MPADLSALRFFFLLLVLVGLSSCASMNLYSWAAESAPRSEVLGFVDRGGEGDALLVRMDGERGHADGLYEVAVAAPTQGRLSADSPRRVERVRAAQLLAASRDAQSAVRLDKGDAGSQVGWLLIDGFDSIDGEFHRIRIPERRYYLSDEGQIAADASTAAATWIKVHEQDGYQRPYSVRGSARLPPARTVPRRIVIGVAAAPLIVALDVVTLPLQVLGMLVLSGNFSMNQPGGVGFGR